MLWIHPAPAPGGPPAAADGRVLRRPWPWPCWWSGRPGSGSSPHRLLLHLRVPALAVAAGRGGRRRVLAGHRRRPRRAQGRPAGLVAYLRGGREHACRCAGWPGSPTRATSRDEQRKQALAELSEANRRLEATLAENAGLHAQLLTQATGGRRPGRAAADGPGDPRHPGPGPDRDHHPAAGRRAGRPTAGRAARGTSPPRTGLARESLTEARRSVHALRPEPLEAARLSDALAGVARALVAPCTAIPVPVTTTGTAAADAAGGRVGAAAHGPGGAGQRGQARARHAASA